MQCSPESLRSKCVHTKLVQHTHASTTGTGFVLWKGVLANTAYLGCFLCSACGTSCHQSSAATHKPCVCERKAYTADAPAVMSQRVVGKLQQQSHMISRPHLAAGVARPGGLRVPGGSGAHPGLRGCSPVLAADPHAVPEGCDAVDCTYEHQRVEGNQQKLPTVESLQKLPRACAAAAAATRAINSNPLTHNCWGRCRPGIRRLLCTEGAPKRARATGARAW